MFIYTTIFNFIIGNADAHAKDYSFLYLEGMPRLAPVYDLISTAAHPQLSKKMAMKIGGKYKPEEVMLRHWHQLVSDTQLARNTIKKDLKSLQTTFVKRHFT